jgi:hypothetical protein
LASFQKRGSLLVKGRFSEGLMDRFGQVQAGIDDEEPLGPTQRSFDHSWLGVSGRKEMDIIFS